MKRGAIVKWKEPATDAERCELHVVIDDNGTSVKCRAVGKFQNWKIRPIFTYRSEELTEAAQINEEQ